MGGSEHPIVDVPKELLDGSAVHILILEFFPHRLNDPDTRLIGYLSYPHVVQEVEILLLDTITQPGCGSSLVIRDGLPSRISKV